MKELPIISVNEARKLLGKEAQEMDDEQVMQVILILTEAAQAYLLNINAKYKKGLKKQSWKR